MMQGRPTRRVIAVCPNPSLDKTMAVNQGVGPRRATRVAVSPGGKPIHASTVASALGAAVTVIAPLGGVTGRRLRDELTGEIDLRVVPISRNTRETVTVVDDQGTYLEIIEPSPVVSEQEVEGVLAELADALPTAGVLITGGSLPATVPTGFYARLVEIASSAGVPAIVDASGDALKAALECEPALVKPNLDEASALLGCAPSDLATRQGSVKAVHRILSFGAQRVWLTLGENGSVFARRDGSIWRIGGVRAPVVNSVGCGDAAIGGYVAAVVEDQDDVAAIRLGAAAATSKLSHLEPDLIAPMFARQAASDVKVERVA
jgi:1-phosphofructokinase family hexose kinase